MGGRLAISGQSYERLEKAGPGIHLVARERAEIPSSATSTVDALTYAIKVPQHILNRQGAREIVIDPHSFSKVRLK
jgi:hypothetical protein